MHSATGGSTPTTVRERIGVPVGPALRDVDDSGREAGYELSENGKGSGEIACHLYVDDGSYNSESSLCASTTLLPRTSTSAVARGTAESRGRSNRIHRWSKPSVVAVNVQAECESRYRGQGQAPIH